MNKRSLVIFCAYWFFACMLIPTDAAWAYIDPATTTYIIQVAAAIVITLGVSLGIFLYKLQMIVTNIKVSTHALFKRLRKKQETSSDKDKSDNAMLSEEEALASGVIDFPVPVRKTYPALGTYTVYKTSEEPAEQPSVGRLESLANWLWADERSFKQRALMAILVAAGFAITFVIFSMLDSVILNESELSFSLEDIVWPVVFLGLAVFAVLSVVLLLIRGRVFNFVLCVLLAVLVCGYLQITFFNSNLGELIGLPLGWDELGVSSVLTNLALWLAIGAIVFFLGFSSKARSRNLFKQFAVFVPALLISVQLIALITLIPSDRNADGDSVIQTLSTDRIYEVSADENIIIFVLDMLDEKFINNIVEEDPEFFEELDGFTRFTNNITRHNETFPSVVNLMTAVPFNPHIPNQQYTDEAFGEGSFISDIREQGFSSDLYMEKWFTYTDHTPLDDYADNLDNSPYTVDLPKVLSNLTQLTLLKSSPLALKSLFPVNPDAFNITNTVIVEDESEPFAADDVTFYNDLKSNKLSVSEESKRFAYYHLNGSHYPWYVNADVEAIEEQTTPEEQTKGAFKIVYEYLDQMREQGLYENATIIITGDHPYHMAWVPPEEPILTGLFVKPAGNQESPLKLSNAPVTVENLRATCVKAAGGDHTAWGKSYFELAEDEDVVRDYYNRYSNDTDQAKIAHFQITGDARDWKNWTLVETISYDPANRKL